MCIIHELMLLVLLRFLSPKRIRRRRRRRKRREQREKVSASPLRCLAYRSDGALGRRLLHHPPSSRTPPSLFSRTDSPKCGERRETESTHLLQNPTQFFEDHWASNAFALPSRGQNNAYWSVFFSFDDYVTWRIVNFFLRRFFLWVEQPQDFLHECYSCSCFRFRLVRPPHLARPLRRPLPPCPSPPIFFYYLTSFILFYYYFIVPYFTDFILRFVSICFYVSLVFSSVLYLASRIAKV